MASLSRVWMILCDVCARMCPELFEVAYAELDRRYHETDALDRERAEAIEHSEKLRKLRAKHQLPTDPEDEHYYDS